jgi:hypothetical protein
MGLQANVAIVAGAADGEQINVVEATQVDGLGRLTDQRRICGDDGFDDIKLIALMLALIELLDANEFKMCLVGETFDLGRISLDCDDVSREKQPIAMGGGSDDHPRAQSPSPARRPPRVAPGRRPVFLQTVSSL